MSLEQRLEEFFSIAINYFGFEIALPLNQHFSINQFFSEDEEDATYSFRIQYGYPQTGCIIMDSTYVLDEDEYYIEDVSIFVPPADKEFLLREQFFVTQLKDSVLRINVDSDDETIEHSSPDEIMANPNALLLLETATIDLKNALIIQKNTLILDINDNTIACCNTVPYEHTNKRLM